jgi:hypothetical protein
MIEIHLDRVESGTAITTRDLLERAQERDRAVLPTPDAIEFALPVCRVVRDVERTLVSFPRHGPV